MAKISGAASVTMVDVDADRLKFAKEQGLADAIVQIPLSKRDGESVGDFIARMAENVRTAHGEEADLALECTGIESCLNICIGSVTAGAKIVLVGMGAPRQELNLGLALVREIEILPIWRYTNTFQAAINLIAAGIVDVKPMITHTFEVEKVVDALEFALSRPANLIKCVITSK
jgi:L-iditol 2-dehydrogenase